MKAYQVICAILFVGLFVLPCCSMFQHSLCTAPQDHLKQERKKSAKTRVNAMGHYAAQNGDGCRIMNDGINPWTMAGTGKMPVKMKNGGGVYNRAGQHNPHQKGVRLWKQGK